MVSAWTPDRVVWTSIPSREDYLLVATSYRNQDKLCLISHYAQMQTFSTYQARMCNF